MTRLVKSAKASTNSVHTFKKCSCSCAGCKGKSFPTRISKAKKGLNDVNSVTR